MANEKQTDTRRGGSSNFTNDPQRASEAGKKGGEHSHGGAQKSSSGASHSEHEKASDAGKKSGEHSHGGK
jgi:uncharacterized protein